MWLIQQDTLRAISPVNFDAKLASAPFESGAALALTGATATIPINGVLTKSPDFLSAFFGGGNTTYKSIIESINTANTDPSVSEIVLSIDSPGGTVAGLFATLDVIKASSKPIRAVVDGLAASAAYAIAAMCTSIEISSRGDRLGSIGIVIEGRRDESSYSITSTNAQNKRPDEATPEGMAEIKRSLDQTEDLFSEYIAEGRNIPHAELMDKFGNGSVFLADEAIERGMADGFLKETPNTNSNPGDNSMDAKQLETEHAATFAEVKALGSAEAMQRVNAHLHMAEKTGAHDVAHEAIKAGAGLTDEYVAQYTTAGIAKAVGEQNQSAADDVNEQLNNVNNTPLTDDAKAAALVQEEASADAVIEDLKMQGLI